MLSTMFVCNGQSQYSSLSNCRGEGHFAFFEIFQPQNHLIMTPPHFMTFLPKRAKTFIFLGVFTKITPKSPYYDPPFYGFFLAVSTPLQLGTEEYSLKL